VLQVKGRNKVNEQQLRRILLSTLAVVRDQQAKLFELGWEVAALRDAVCEIEPRAAQSLPGTLAKYRSRDLDTYEAFRKRFAELAAQLQDA
jgi:hypothetical protein